MAGFFFDIDQSNICKDIQKNESLGIGCLPIPQKKYRITKRLRAPEEFEKYFPGFMAFIDWTEQHIPRPKYKDMKKAYFSGKKKRYTVKTQLMVNNYGYIIHKADHKKGKRHDYNIYKNNNPATPPIQVVNVFDLGYIGVEKDLPDQLPTLPYKKKVNQELSQE